MEVLPLTRVTYWFRRIRMCTSIIKMNQSDEHCIQTRIFLDALIEFLCATDKCLEEATSTPVSQESHQLVTRPATLSAMEDERDQRDCPQQQQLDIPQGIVSSEKVDPDSSSANRFVTALI